MESEVIAAETGSGKSLALGPLGPWESMWKGQWSPKVVVLFEVSNMVNLHMLQCSKIEL